jgi:hypothetical protein
VLENQHKRSIKDDIARRKKLMPWIGHLPVEGVRSGILQPWIATTVSNKGVRFIFETFLGVSPERSRKYVAPPYLF